jgi:hypothetical protein
MELVKDHVVVSGGWAWHFMTETGHPEYKHLHDHKDVDLFAKPEDAYVVMEAFRSNGYRRAKTMHDHQREFWRYEKGIEVGDQMVKVTIDLFIRDVPFIEVKGWKIVRPAYLLSLYGTVHANAGCFAKMVAQELLDRGESPIDHPRMARIPVYPEKP